MGQISSMTGFARHDGTHAAHSWHWELRSVNGRGLDVRLRMPGGFDALEQDVRKRATKHLNRGNLQISLNTRREAGDARIALNETAFRQVLDAAQRAAEIAGTETPSIEHLLSVRNVLDASETEQTEDEKSALDAALLASFDEALDRVVSMRKTEGTAMRNVLTDTLDAMRTQLNGILASPARTREAMQARLSEQLAKLGSDDERIDENRLHQEVALLLTKADISEELTRLEAHIDAVRALLNEGGACGRRLDFWRRS